MERFHRFGKGWAGIILWSCGIFGIFRRLDVVECNNLPEATFSCLLLSVILTSL